MPSRRKSYLTKPALTKRLAGIKALVLDVDGVLTDDHLYVGADGFELKQFHIGDGLTMVLAMRAGLEIIIMSNRPSAATTTRMNDLMVKHVIQARGEQGETGSRIHGRQQPRLHDGRNRLYRQRYHGYPAHARSGIKNMRQRCV